MPTVHDIEELREAVLQYDPYHGYHGRFASGAGEGGSAGGSARPITDLHRLLAPPKVHAPHGVGSLPHVEKHEKYGEFPRSDVKKGRTGAENSYRKLQGRQLTYKEQFGSIDKEGKLKVMDDEEKLRIMRGAGIQQHEIEQYLEHHYEAARVLPNGEKAGKNWYREAHYHAYEKGASYGTRGVKIDGRWYEQQRIPGHRMAAAIAVLSPETQWEKNKANAGQIADHVVKLQHMREGTLPPDRITITAGHVAALKAAKVPTDLHVGDVVDAHTLRPEEVAVVTKYENMGGKGEKANVPKALKILMGHDPYHVVGGPKVSNFHNNLLDPHDPRFSTVDTWMYRAGTGWDKYNPDAGHILNVRVPPHDDFGHPLFDVNGDVVKGPLKTERMTLGQYEMVATGNFGKRMQWGHPADIFQDSDITINKQQVSQGTYHIWQDAINNNAAKHNLLPNEYQAIVWQHIMETSQRDSPAKEVVKAQRTVRK